MKRGMLDHCLTYQCNWLRWERTVIFFPPQKLNNDKEKKVSLSGHKWFAETSDKV